MSNFEKEMSFKEHSRYFPVLISSLLLRKYGCGQIDLSYIKNNELQIIELKSSKIGIQAMFTKQYKRLLLSVALLQSLLNIPVNLKIIAKR